MERDSLRLSAHGLALHLAGRQHRHDGCVRASFIIASTTGSAPSNSLGAPAPRARAEQHCRQATPRERGARTHLPEVDGLSRAGRFTVAADAGHGLARAQAVAFSRRSPLRRWRSGPSTSSMAAAPRPRGHCARPNAISSRFMDTRRRSLQSSPGMQQSSSTARDIMARAVPGDAEPAAEPGRPGADPGERFARLGSAR